MPCEQSQNQLHGYLDGELDAVSSANFERHLETCADCKRVLADEQALRQSLQKANLYDRAPQSLHEKVRVSIGAVRPAPTRFVWPWQWLSLAAAAVVLAILVWQLPLRFGNANDTSVLASAAVDAHLRALQPGHLVDVESTDQHTVKPWFDGRIDFAPPVRDFAPQGFPLLGGRLDVINGQTAAALVYGRRKHLINVFVLKANPGDRPAASGDVHGYHWAAWEQDGLQLFAVSDVSADDLAELHRLFTQN